MTGFERYAIADACSVPEGRLLYRGSIPPVTGSA